MLERVGAPAKNPVSEHDRLISSRYSLKLFLVHAHFWSFCGCPEDRAEKLPDSSDNRLARAAFGFETIIEATQIGTVSYSGERALHQHGMGNFAAMLGDTANTLAIVGLVDMRRNAEVSGEMAEFAKILNVANGDQDYGCRGCPDAFDGDQAFRSRKRFGNSNNFCFQPFRVLTDHLQLGADAFQFRSLHIAPFTTI